MPKPCVQRDSHERGLYQLLKILLIDMKPSIFVFSALLIPLIASLVLLGACDTLGDLDEEPRDFASLDNFYTNPGQIEGAFASSMNDLWGFWRAGYDWSLIQAFQHTDQFDGGDLVIEANHASHLWNKHYSGLKDINFAIASVEQGRLEGVSQDVEDELMGQAKFLRAWNYFMLVRMFGALPLPTEEHTDDYFSYQHDRQPIEEVYRLIVSDLEEAIDKLPPTWSSDNVGRPSGDVAKAMLAKVYLTMATHPMNDASYYEDAAEYARQVMETDRYWLVEDIHDVFSFETEDGPEMMWTFESNSQYQTISPQVWSEMRGWGDQTAQDVWVEAYPEQPRKHAYLELVDENGDTWQEVGASPGIKKYLYDTPEDHAAGRSFINLPIMRYADVLLIFAEAENMANGGPTQEAVDAVNQVINRANGYEYNEEHPPLSVDMSQEEFDRAVIHERNLELCFEYDRWFDIVRKRILKEVSRPEIVQNFSEDDYLFPIPESVLRLNENLEQNPGY